MTCPDCKGIKVMTGIGCGSDGCRPVTIPCFTCDGAGTIDDAHAERIAKGRALYEDRVSRDGRNLFSAPLFFCLTYPKRFVIFLIMMYHSARKLTARYLGTRTERFANTYEATKEQR